MCADEQIKCVEPALNSHSVNLIITINSVYLYCLWSALPSGVSVYAPIQKLNSTHSVPQSLVIKKQKAWKKKQKVNTVCLYNIVMVYNAIYSCISVNFYVVEN